MAKAVHQEAPMFSYRTACGRRLTKDMHYAWGTLKLITCKPCRKKARKSLRSPDTGKA